MRIAILEDDLAQAGALESLLAGDGHQVHVFTRGRALLASLAVDSYDLLILDWGLPDLSGMEVLATARPWLKGRTPVLFLTQRDAEADVVLALEGGADDYITKPPREREFLSRVRALGRRAAVAPADAQTFVAGPFLIDVARQRIERDGVPVPLTRREFDVAVLFCRNVGKVLSRAHILEAVWGRGDCSTTRTVDTHVSRLRAALGLSADSGVRLTPVYGYGYRLDVAGSDRP
jgi:DNA-binding response OmpR family regulator